MAYSIAVYVLSIFVCCIFVLSSHFTHVELRKHPFCLKNVHSMKNENEKNEIIFEWLYGVRANIINERHAIACVGRP